MTERLADVTARIAGVRQLGAVVKAMTGIAAARARQARAQLAPVEDYAATIAGAMGRVLAFSSAAGGAPPPAAHARRAEIVFLAEQGFAGAFSERVLDRLEAEAPAGSAPPLRYLVGSRGLAVAAGRGLVPDWQAPMPSHAPGVPKFANRIATDLAPALAAGRIARLEVVYSLWEHGAARVARQPLFPIDLALLPRPGGAAPLTTLPAAELLAELGADYLHALLCAAALRAFSAENEARMAAMAAARSQIERELATLEASERRVRQEAITAEIIELAAGEAASRGGAPGEEARGETGAAAAPPG